VRAAFAAAFLCLFGVGNLDRHPMALRSSDTLKSSS
jgi:hypothetical protein